MIRHMVLNTIRAIRIANKKKYGELVIAADNKNYWRKEAFPYYKASRKKAQSESELDWNAIFKCLHIIKAEIAEVFQYPFVEVEHAEADDVIGTLCHKFGVHLCSDDTDRILIISGDKDYKQLQTYANVDQYDPIKKKRIVCDNPEQYLLEHIIKGDAIDGIPNMLSDDDTFVTSKRQKPVTEKRLKDLIARINSYELTDLENRNYNRNKQLIDLTCIPEHINIQIINKYMEQKNKEKGDLFSYFIKHRLKNLMERINDFV